MKQIRNTDAKQNQLAKETQMCKQSNAWKYFQLHADETY